MRIRTWMSLSALALLAMPTLAEEIGTVAAVNRDMRGTPPGAAARALILGNQVVQDELIQTSQVGSGQLMFVDQTTLSVAPNSDIVLDRYVYDPDRQAGDMALTLTRGALRFVGGRISKTRDVEVVTPTATIGIRGALVTILVAPDGSTQVFFGAGEYVRIVDGSGRAVTLSRPNATAGIPFGGIVTFTGLADVEDYRGIYGSFEGTGTGGSEAGADPSAFDNGTAGIASLNSGVEGGETALPVSTSGEQPASEADELLVLDVIGNDPDDDLPPGAVDDSPAAPPPPVATGIGGALASQTLGIQTFQTVTLGSLIGTTATGEVFTLPIPISPGDFVLTLSNGQTPTFFAQSISTDAGFFEFGLGSNPNTFGTSSTLGAVAGFGFSDLDVGFHVYEFTSTAAANPDEGVVLFGTPSAGQGSVSPADDGTAPATANTGGIYVLEPQLNPDLAGPTDNLDIHVIANGGEARAPHSSHSLASNGGRVLTASAEVSTDTSGVQQSEFFVFSPEIFQQGSGGLRFGGTAMSTSQERGTDLQLAFPTAGTFEDADGNAVFGEDDNYLLITSLARPDGVSPYSTDTGIERALGGPDEALDPLINVATRDPSADVIVLDPLALPLDPASIGGITGTAQLTGFATGFARCSTGNCGEGSPGGGTSGVYSLQGPAELVFDGSASAGGDSNSVAFLAALTGNDSNITPGQGANGRVEEFAFTNASGLDATGYLDDSLFGGAAIDQVSAGSANGNVVDLDLSFASSELAGDGGVLPTFVDPAPDYVRWGWWSASYEVPEGSTGTTREDAIHMGTFVFGALTDPTQLPTQGIVDFAGLAVGTRADLASGATEIVGGDFALSFDFGRARGSFDLNIGGYSVSGLPAIGQTGSPTYDVTAFGENSSFVASGQFYAGGGNPVAATGGSFDIWDGAASEQITGVFAGDSVAIPGGGGP